MDHRLVKKVLRRRRWIYWFVGVGASSYAAYRVYHLPSVARKRRKLVKLLGAMVSVIEMVSDSAETIALVNNDLKEFLQSDTDQIPRSLRQLSKITSSVEFSKSLSRVTEALTVGIVCGYKAESGKESGTASLNTSGKLMDKLLSKAGTGFVSVVVGSFAKNIVLGFYSKENEPCDQNGTARMSMVKSSSSEMPRWLDAVSDDRCKDLIADCIQKFVGTAVAVYLDKTQNVNTYEGLFDGLTNPKYETKMQDILVSVCNGAVETLVRTSHQVLTSSNSTAEDESECPKTVYNEAPIASKHQLWRNSSPEVKGSDGWANKVSTTLSVPSNIRFVLDVTGRVTFETVRSLLVFFFWNLSESIRRCFGAVHGEVVGRGLEVAGYVGAKSSVIVTICLAFFLHVLGGARVLAA